MLVLILIAAFFFYFALIHFSHQRAGKIYPGIILGIHRVQNKNSRAFFYSPVVEYTFKTNEKVIFTGKPHTDIKHAIGEKIKVLVLNDKKENAILCKRFPLTFAPKISSLEKSDLLTMEKLKSMNVIWQETKKDKTIKVSITTCWIFIGLFLIAAFFTWRRLGPMALRDAEYFFTKKMAWEEIKRETQKSLMVLLGIFYGVAVLLFSIVRLHRKRKML